MKSKFEWRVDGFDRMGQAGVHKIGMGVLIGSGGMADRRNDDGLSSALFTETLLENKIQRKLPAYASV